MRGVKANSAAENKKSPCRADRVFAKEETREEVGQVLTKQSGCFTSLELLRHLVLLLSERERLVALENNLAHAPGDATVSRR